MHSLVFNPKNCEQIAYGSLDEIQITNIPPRSKLGVFMLQDHIEFNMKGETIRIAMPPKYYSKETKVKTLMSSIDLLDEKPIICLPNDGDHPAHMKIGSGDSSYIMLKPSGPGLDFQSQKFDVMKDGFTVAVKFNFVGNVVSRERIIDFNNQKNKNIVYLGRSEDKDQLEFHVKVEEEEVTVVLKNQKFQQNKVYFLVLTLDGKDPSSMGEQKRFMSVYVNGVYSGCYEARPKGGAHNTTTATTFERTWVGKSSTPQEIYLSATIYYMSVYKRALSHNEVASKYLKTFRGEVIRLEQSLRFSMLSLSVSMIIITAM